MRQLLLVLQGSKMFHSFAKKTITVLTDWLVAIVGVCLILWFVITLPTFSFSKSKVETTDSLNISQKNLKKHVEILAYNFAPRTIGYGTINAAARYIKRNLSEFGDTNYQPYSTLSGRFSNVVLKIGPNTKEIFVIGAHYDAKNDSLDDEGNASGVSALIELARHLSENEDKLAIGVELVAYPLSDKKSVSIEDMGSYQHASSLSASNKKVQLMLSLDGVGSFTDSKKSQKYPFEFMNHVYPETGNYISLVGRFQDYSKILAFKRSFKKTSTLPLYSFNLPTSHYLKNSFDHLNYQRLGFPAMLITDTAENRALDKNGKEVVEQQDYEKIAMLVRGLYKVVMDSESENKIHSGFVQQEEATQMIIYNKEGML